ncbi:MAG: serine hydrolase domain-containing protein [Acidimicrobiaceae bacterium]
MTQLPVDVDPGEVGLDAHRLARIESHFAKLVDDGRLPGWHIAVSRGGKLAYNATYGHADVENGKPIADDTIYRIYSMTKPICAVAALILWEEGKFEMHDQVKWFIPSFANQKVFRSGTLTAPRFDPVTEPMEMWHLFSHTAGMTYGFVYSNPVDQMYRNAGFEWGTPRDASLADICDILAGLPLMFQPGTEWAYSMSIDVLGRVVEILSGMTLGEFMQKRIFEPLGMTDTAFHCSADKADRLAALYVPNPADNRRRVRNDAGGAGALVDPKAHLGGGGLVSTMSDYMKFAEMLRGGGQLNGVRILSPRTVSFMASNHLPNNADLTAFGRPLFAETAFDGVGFGLSVSVTLDPVKAKVAGSVGDYGWGGAASTNFTVDPKEDLVYTIMTQLMPSSTWPLRPQLKQLVHQALVD